MLINKFGPLGTDLDRMTLKFRPREPVIKNSKWPTIWNLVILKIFHIFHVTKDIALKFGTGDAHVCMDHQEQQQCNILIFQVIKWK